MLPATIPSYSYLNIAISLYQLYNIYNGLFYFNLDYIALPLHLFYFYNRLPLHCTITFTSWAALPRQFLGYSTGEGGTPSRAQTPDIAPVTGTLLANVPGGLKSTSIADQTTIVQTVYKRLMMCSDYVLDFKPYYTMSV